MDYFLNKMEYKHKFSVEEIAGFIVIALIIATAIWMLSGSPTETGAIIGIFAFVATSDIFIWKKIFSVENKISLGFMKVKHDMGLMENRIMNKLNNIEGKIK